MNDPQVPYRQARNLNPGRIVMLMGHETNGTMRHPAMVTRVWSQVDYEAKVGGCVNLNVFLDALGSVPFTSIEYGGASGEGRKLWWCWLDEVPAE